MADQTTLTVVYKPIDGLIPFANNARTHSDAQVAQIAASIREFSFTNPVLIDGDGGIIAGHGRVLAARQLGMATVPCIRLGHLTKTQKRALVIADNKLAINAGWSDELLRLELEELETAGFELDLTGFSQIEIDSLLGEPLAVEDPAQAWDGMPEFTHEDQNSAHRIIVHFATMEDFQAFAELVGQNIPESAKFIWHPKLERARFHDKRYVAENDAA